MPVFNGTTYGNDPSGLRDLFQAQTKASQTPASLPQAGGTGTPYDFSQTGAKFAPNGQNIYGQPGVGGNWEGGKGWYTDYAPNKVFAGEQLNPEYNQGLGLQQQIGTAYQQSLANPQQNADTYGKYFQQAGQAIAAPAMRDFAQQLAGVQGSTAARFGGNASTEEQRNVYNTSDLFSRNLSNSLAALAPQQISAGQAYTNQLGQAYGQASANQAALRNSILSGLSPGANTQYVDPSSNVLGAVIGAVGGTAAAAAGKPSGG